MQHGVSRMPLVVSFTIFLRFQYLNCDLIQWHSKNAVLVASIFISRSQEDDVFQTTLSYTSIGHNGTQNVVEEYKECESFSTFS